VQDFPVLGGTGGVRRRAWDSCQLKCFAEIASGENFRKDRASRLRHRVFRKGRFILERTGKLGCVGCGRCSLHCVAKISILETLRQIADQTVVRDA
jgi:ferredoxin